MPPQPALGDRAGQSGAVLIRRGAAALRKVNSDDKMRRPKGGLSVQPDDRGDFRLPSMQPQPSASSTIQTGRLNQVRRRRVGDHRGEE